MGIVEESEPSEVVKTMINMTATVVPPGGGEADYSFELAMDSVPRVGEYMLLRDSDWGETGAFKVLYVTYMVDAQRETAGGHSHRYKTVEIQIAPVKYPTGPDRAFGGDYYFNNKRWADDVEDYPNSGY